MTKIIALYAIAANGTIGKDNTLPFRQKQDLLRFKKVTLHKTVIMGRKTYQSLPQKLKNRHLIVISREKSGYDMEENVLWVNSIESAIENCKSEKEVFVIGGGEIFNAFFKLGAIDEIWQTYLHSKVEGNVKMELPNDKWVLRSNERHFKDKSNEFDYSFQVFVKHTEKYAIYALVPAEWKEKAEKGQIALAGGTAMVEVFLSHTALAQKCYDYINLASCISVGLINSTNSYAIKVGNKHYLKSTLKIKAL